MSKRARGSYDSAFDDVSKISLIRWNDNSVVTVISNNFTVEPISNTKRYNRKERKDVLISQPDIISQYNQFMGGVDLHDNGISNYRINVRGKKWWWPLFINLVDSVVVNAWRIYKMANKSKLSQLDFKSNIAVRLIKSEEVETKNINLGRPAGIPVPDEVRHDNVGHIILMGEDKARRRCKVCKSHTIYICGKCKVHLHTNCFEAYHQ